MKHFFQRGKSTVTASNILIHLRILIAQVRERIRRETRILEAAESITLRQMIIKGDPSQIEPAVQKYVLGNRRVDALEALLREIQDLTPLAPELVCSAPPVAADSALKSILVTGSFLKLEGFIKFRKVILEPLYGRQRVESMGTRHNMNTVIERGFFVTEVTDEQYNDAIRAIGEFNQVPKETVASFQKKQAAPPPLSYPTVAMPQHVDAGIQTSQRHFAGAGASVKLSQSLGEKYGEHSDLFIPIGVAPIERSLWDGLMLEVIEATGYQ